MLKKSSLMLAFLFIAKASFATALPESQQNKENVLKFYDYALNDKDFAAAKPFLGEQYKQHNPTAKDGIDGFRDFIEFLKKKYPDSRSEIKRVLVDGDYVVLHVAVTGRQPNVTQAIIDIFRLNKQHKIVEHWDVIQTVPDTSANSNGMF
ncbi:ester cyclase [Kluyvera intermedia]|uniref:nuclear transport factor 2 family protein n=1 Tax=Kluyvera intermedia TaxID=61648 RepID=UPI001F3788E1|nr:nuclear transport factor 2 family protein [Kluyvera intermedia]MCE9891123.1 ester cyclase [Kluyvera intermedia]